MASKAKDPITAGIVAFGDIASGVLSLFGLKEQKKIVKQEGINLDKMTEQERLRYYQAVQNGNTEIVLAMQQEQLQKENSANMTTNIIIGSTFLIVLLIIFIKLRKQ